MKKLKNWVAASVFAASTLCLSTSAFALGFNGNNGCDDNGCNTNDCCDEGSFTVSADVLFMEACQSLPYMLQGTAAPGAAGTHNCVYGEYDWDLGFRVNGYYQSDCNGWDANVAFTWFSSEVDEAVTAATATFDHPLIKVENNGAPLSQVNGAQTSARSGDSLALAQGSSYTFTNELDYWTVDALVGHRCCVCPGFEVRPYGGFRALSVEQESAQVFDAATYDPSPTDLAGVRHSIEYQGFGLTAGVETKCTPCNCFCDDLSIFAKVGGSIVGGDLDHEIRDQLAAAATLNTSNYNEACHTSFGYEIALGLSYDHCFCGNWWSLSAGYEMNHWSDVGNPIVTDNESLTLHGFNLRGSFTF